MELPDIEKLKHEIEGLAAQMGRPEVQRDGKKIKRLAAELTEKKELAATAQKLIHVKRDQAEARELAAGEDQDLRALAKEDMARLEAEEAEWTEKLEELLLPKDTRESRDVILEIRSGAGGDEAGLFAQELFRAYARYGEMEGWNVHILSTSLSEAGGYKEVISEVSGEKVFGTLKYERGVHRVQRIPTTEKMGRVHTSTITVAVMPMAEEVDLEIKTEDLRIDTYRASSAGGQHVNKTSSAIRITHLPTNTVVAVQDERSQHKNKAKAMKVLRARLLDAQEEKRQQELTSERRAQVGTGDRSEKIRTYNFPQDRITDHRIKESWNNIAAVMEGNLGSIFQRLQEREKEILLGNK